MSYAPAYNALFAKPLLNQVIAIIQRDQVGAIGVINAARAAAGNNAGLAPVAEFHKGPGIRTTFPWLTVSIDSLDFATTEHGPGEDYEPRPEIVRLALVLDVGQFDQESAQDDASDYARLLDMIITSCDVQAQNAGPKTSWETALPIVHETVPTGTTVPNAAGSVKSVIVTAHKYGLVTLDQVAKPVLRVTVELEFILREN